MKKNLKALEILATLKERHPDAHCELDHENPFQLLVATILSAQCTDVRVNMVTPGLFKRWPTPAKLAQADPAEVEEVVRPTGFYKNKAKNIIGCAAGLVERHGGEVPRSIEELTALPGVGRKTANVVLGNCFGMNEGVVVDTHVRRLAGLLGLTKHDDPEKIELDLMKLFPREEWAMLSHLLIFHGRRVCVARRPQCDLCPLAGSCPSAKRGKPAAKKR